MKTQQKQPTGKTPASAKAQVALRAAMNRAVKEHRPPADLLARIVAAATELSAAVKTLKTYEQKVLDTKSNIHRMRTAALPQMLDEAQIPGLELEGGYRVERDTEVYASIAAKNEQKAADWLRANNLGSIIKDTIEIPIDKGDAKTTERITRSLKKAGIPYAQRSSIHPGTLKALVRERLEEGKKLPKSITYHAQPVVNVKTIKPSKRKQQEQK